MSEADPGLTVTASKMELFVTIADGWTVLNIVIKNSIFDNVAVLFPKTIIPSKQAKNYLKSYLPSNPNFSPISVHAFLLSLFCDNPYYFCQKGQDTLKHRLKAVPTNQNYLSHLVHLSLPTKQRNTGIPGLWTLDSGLWALDPGRWTMNSELSTLVAGLLMLESERWTLDAGNWTLDSGLWMLDSGLWKLDPGH